MPLPAAAVRHARSSSASSRSRPISGSSPEGTAPGRPRSRGAGSALQHARSARAWRSTARRPARVAADRSACGNCASRPHDRRPRSSRAIRRWCACSSNGSRSVWRRVRSSASCRSPRSSASWRACSNSAITRSRWRWRAAQCPVVLEHPRAIRLGRAPARPAGRCRRAVRTRAKSTHSDWSSRARRDRPSTTSGSPSCRRSDHSALRRLARALWSSTSGQNVSPARRG